METQQDKQIPIRFYDRFWTDDFVALPLLVQGHLGDFLEHLVRDPEHKDLLAKCQKARGEPDYWVYLFCSEFALFWHLVRQEAGRYIELSASRVIRIDVLDIRRKDDIPID